MPSRILVLLLLLSGLAAALPDLKRIKVGHQAGIIKVTAPDRKTVVFIKGSEQAEEDVVGIDGVKWAPLNPADRDRLLAVLDIPPAAAATVAGQLMKGYARLPHLEAVALLGALASPGQAGSIPTEKVVRFLQARLTAKETVQVKRQAVLALALIPTVDMAEVQAVIKFMKASHNGWETFTTVQFFEYHQPAILKMAGLEQIKKGLQASGNPRAEGILASLQAGVEPTPR